MRNTIIIVVCCLIGYLSYLASNLIAKWLSRRRPLTSADINPVKYDTDFMDKPLSEGTANDPPNTLGSVYDDPWRNSHEL